MVKSILKACDINKEVQDKEGFMIWGNTLHGDIRCRGFFEAAKAKGIKVVVLTGKDGGKMAGMADVEIRVPYFGYADRIQEIHIKVIHILIMLIEKELAV